MTAPSLLQSVALCHNSLGPRPVNWYNIRIGHTMILRGLGGSVEALYL
jgi:hypothetical protein